MQFLQENPIIPLFLLVLIATALHNLFTISGAKKKAEKKAREAFGQIPKKREVKDYIRDYHQYVTEAEGATSAVDAITWQDLNMDDVFARINTCASSVGEEYLYHLLHELCFDKKELAQRDRLIYRMEENDTDRLRLQNALLSIGRKQGGLSFYLFHAATKRLKNAWTYTVRALLPFLGIPIAFVNPVYGGTFLIVAGLANVVTYYRRRLNLDMEMETMQQFSAFLYAARKIEAERGDMLREFGLDLKKPLAVFKRMGGFIPGQARSMMMELEEITVFFRAVFLWDFIKYNHTIEHLDRYQAEVREIFRVVGEADSAISVASFRQSLPYYCKPVFQKENAVIFTELLHPLLEHPVSNSGHIDNDVIITGSNASGKSTFIKTVAVNHILAQTIHTCTARAYALRPSYVCSSMAIKDDILAGESYFIAEIKSLKRVIAYAKQRPCICLIDEILRGTNTPERIAASTAVLRALHETDSLCLIASHDIELTDILKDLYDNYHFRESFIDGEITFDYQLHEGPSTTTNAIKLLAYMGFEKEIVAEAARRVKS
jgi:hypothetical protein